MVYHFVRLPIPIVLAFGFFLSSTCSPARGEEADPFKPPAIETAEVPPVPAALVQQLEQYMDVRAASFAGWDPAGKGLLIRTRFGNSPLFFRSATARCAAAFASSVTLAGTGCPFIALRGNALAALIFPATAGYFRTRACC